MNSTKHRLNSLLCFRCGATSRRICYGLVTIAIVITHIWMGMIPAAAKTAAGLVESGKIAYEQGNFPTALTIWEQAEATYARDRDLAGVTGSQVNQAQATIEMGFYRRACKILTATVKTAENVCETSIPTQFGILQTNIPPTLQVMALGTFADVLRRLGNLDAAQVTLATAGKIAKPLGAGSRSPILLSIANTWRDLGNRDLYRTNRLQDPVNTTITCPTEPISNLTAAAYYQRSLACYHQAGSLTADINQLSLEVEISRWLETPAQRLITGNWQPQFHQSTLINQIQTQLPSQPYTNAALNQQINFARSLALLQQPQWDRARELLEQVITQGRLLDRKSVLATAIGTLGWLYEQKHQWAEAIDFTQQALTLITSLENDTRYQWEWQLGRILQAQTSPDLVRSQAAYDRAIATLEQTRRNLRVINADAQLSLRDRIEPLYREAIDLSLRIGNPDLAKIIARVDALKLAELENFLQCQLGEYRLVTDFDRDPGAVVFYPVILADRLELILGLADGKFQRLTIPVTRAQLETTIDRFRQDLTAPQYGWNSQAATQLYDWLIRPAHGVLTPETKNLVFVIDGALQNIPMGALYDRLRREYLIERYPVAVTPGLKILGAKQAVENRTGILIGGLTAESGIVQNGKRGNIYDPLTYATTEIQTIKSLFPRSTELVGKNFTPANIQRVLASGDYSTIHLATHGQFSSDPRQTFIITANGEKIDLNGIRSMLQQHQSHSIDSIVFSACETATGDRYAALGLAGTAIRSGARSIIASMWSVDDRATAKLMEKFYTILTQNPRVSKATALQMAQKAMRQEYEHPYYWASFVFVGNWL